MRWAERVSTERWLQAESPRWTGADEVCWVDMRASLLVVGRLSPSGLTVVRTEEVGRRIGSAARIAGSDDWAVACDREVRRVAPDGSQSTIASLPPGPGFMNDGVADPAGRFWTGTQTIDRVPQAALYSVERDGSVAARLTDVTVSNGICFTPDGSTLYYIDTLPGRSIEAFDVAPDGTLSGRRLVVRIEGGNPDGLAIDRDGALWVAVWGIGEARRYSPDGRLLETIRIPAARASAVALVGSTLLITSAQPADPADDEGGHIFAAEVEVPGSLASAVAIK